MEVVETLETVEIRDDKIYKYIYRIIKSKYENIDAYGIEAEMQEIKENKVIDIERDSINIISSRIEKVRYLLEILHKNKVSPIHFIDVLGEEIDSYVEEFDTDCVSV